MENSNTIGLIKQRLEILYALVNELESSSDSSYTKTQTDSLLAAKADKSTTYTKTETNTLLSSNLTAISDTDYAALTVKDKPLYFIYAASPSRGTKKSNAETLEFVETEIKLIKAQLEKLGADSDGDKGDSK